MSKFRDVVYSPTRVLPSLSEADVIRHAAVESALELLNARRKACYVVIYNPLWQRYFMDTCFSFAEALRSFRRPACGPLERAIAIVHGGRVLVQGKDA